MCLSDFVIQLTDNLDYLSDVQVAEKKLFLVQGRKPQLMNWEQFGLRIGIEEDSLSSYETVEVATAALVGGQFKFPKNTVLVSAVYAVSISEPLLKPLRLEVQHCVDLRGRPRSESISQVCHRSSEHTKSTLPVLISRGRRVYIQ